MNSTVVILITLIFAAFFSGIEIAFISASKLRIALKSKQGLLSARILSVYVKQPSRFISTTLIGINIALVVYSIHMESIIERYFDAFYPQVTSQPVKIFVKTLISTIIVLFGAEFLPKVLFRLNADRLLSVFVFPFQLFYYLLWPVVHFITWLSKKILNRLTKNRFSEKTPVFTRVDLDQYISESANLDLEEDADVDTEIFRNAMDFANVKVRDCMVHRTELVGVDVSEPINALYEEFVKSGHSKVLVYEGSIDKIIGYVHQVEMFKKPASIRSILMPIIITNESMPASDLLKQLTTNHRSMALVVDEFGGTAGIVTIEDIMEQVFGNIEDEHDVEELLEKKISDTEYRLSARLEIEYLNETYNLGIPQGEYETLGGFIIDRYESIPKEGEKVIIGKFEFIILKTINARIDEVMMFVQG